MGRWGKGERLDVKDRGESNFQCNPWQHDCQLILGLIMVNEGAEVHLTGSAVIKA